MKLRGRHRTRYDYSAPVYLEPHILRLRPRSEPRQFVEEFSVEMSPEPAGISQGLDAYGNHTVWTWFSGLHDAFEIETRFTVETARDNPFDFIAPTAEALMIPPPYTESERIGLGPYLTLPPEGPSPVGALAREVVEQTGSQTGPFLAELAARIRSTCETIVRPEGDPFEPEDTLSAGRGSCRDLAVLYVAACRYAGVAARFVSGYTGTPAPGQEQELHAWAGAYLPGGGWRGYDPTQGLAVAADHITLAVAAIPSGAAPVEGSFRGKARSELSSEIDITVVDPGRDR